MRTRHTTGAVVAAVTLLASIVQADIITATLKFSNASELLAHADHARDQGERVKALALYKRALNTYTELASRDPDFQSQMVEFRMEYCDSQLAALLDNLYPTDNTNVTTDAMSSNVLDFAMAMENPLPANSATLIRELIIAARREIENGEPEAARQRLVKGFELDPDNADLRILAGLAQCQARKFDDAIFLLRELADEQPSNAPVRVALAAACFGAGQLPLAQKELEKAIQLEPDLKDAHYNMAQLLMTTASPDFDAVRRHYQRARDLGAAPDLRLEGALVKKQD